MTNLEVKRYDTDRDGDECPKCTEAAERRVEPDPKVVPEQLRAMDPHDTPAFAKVLMDDAALQIEVMAAVGVRQEVEIEGLKNKLRVMAALTDRSNAEQLLHEPTAPLVPVGGDSDKFVCPTCLGEGSVFAPEPSRAQVERERLAQRLEGRPRKAVNMDDIGTPHLREDCEPTLKQTRDADHCDYPDCEQHNTLVVQRMQEHFRCLGWQYDIERNVLIELRLAESRT